MTQLHEMTREERTEVLVNDLAKPTFVYRLAKGDDRANSGAQKRRDNALREIDRLVCDYVEDRLTHITR